MKSRTGTFSFTLEGSTAGPVAGFGGETVDWEEEVAVEYSYMPGNPGCHTMRNGDPGYPPDPPEAEIIKITGSNGRNIDFDELPEKVQDQMVEEAIADAENVKDAEMAQLDDELERRRDVRADMQANGEI